MSNPELETIDPEWANLFRRTDGHRTTLVEALSQIEIFSLLTDRELAKLARIVHLRRFTIGETVIQRGVEQSGFYLVISGSVDIVRQGLDVSRNVVGNLGPFELLGEFALVDSAPRNSSIVAAESSELIGFFKPDLMEILATDSVLGCKILLRLAEEMCRSLARDYGKLQAMGYPFPEGVEEVDPEVQADPTVA